MDELTRCLYEFVCEKRLGSLSEDQEYIDAVLGAERQEKRVASYLSKEQQLRLLFLAQIGEAGGLLSEQGTAAGAARADGCGSRSGRHYK